MPDKVLYYLKNLNLSISFRIGSRSPATFKAELSTTTVKNSFQLFPIFCHKELYLRCCIELELIFVIWSTKVQGVSGYQGSPQSHKMVEHIQTICWLLPTNCLSVFDHFVVLTLRGLGFLHLISNGLNDIKFWDHSRRLRHFIYH